MTDFVLFYPPHLIVLLLVGAISIFSFWAGLNRIIWVKPFRIIYGFVILITLILFYQFHLSRGIFDFSRHLPFHLCSISAYLAMFMCFFPSKRLFWVLNFWGFVAALITLILPDMGAGAGWNSFRFFEMMMTHGMIVVAISLFLPVYSSSLKFKYFIFAELLLIAFALIIGLIINPLLNGNYLYLTEKPSGGQMNFLPDSNPLFAFSLCAFVVAVIAVQYLITLSFLKLTKTYGQVE